MASTGTAAPICGVLRVPASVGAAAGQGNSAAVGYHFGTKACGLRLRRSLPRPTWSRLVTVDPQRGEPRSLRQHSTRAVL
ncbi:hypothetical protein OG874_07510 [Nocardia sp. NBC_00565]|uniref:hypothetical protein n=1 Tax=Nocardia sp. NBC_00565 TaxID=2975993 RepID=UPI002E81F167|nr:hypothetical protein [Nocardia sp. NBC_00565]WUC04994.1 hypothetical protein OG874_07510 [Nocardia sp. NBC_00565]